MEHGVHVCVVKRSHHHHSSVGMKLHLHKKKILHIKKKPTIYQKQKTKLQYVAHAGKVSFEPFKVTQCSVGEQDGVGRGGEYM